MRQFAIGARYSRLDFQQVAPDVAAVAFPTPALPTSRASSGGRPEAIFVQAVSTNTASITISTGTPVDKGAGIELVPGANMILPTNRWDLLKHISSAAQKLNIVYMAGQE